MVAKINTRQIGPYQLKTRFAQNNVTGVYLATHTETGAEVALRVLYNTDSPRAQELFLTCAREIAALSHPALVPVLDFGKADEAVYIAMKRMKGGSLKDRLEKHRSTDNHERVLPVEALPSLGEVADFLDRITSALSYLHSQDTMHYQIQPSNILFDEHGQAYLADTGLARILKIVFSLAETNAINTHPYASPEQWNGEVVGAAADQYSLACLVYELVTGRPLFQSNSIFQLMNMHMNEFLIPPHHVRPGVPAGLTIVLVRALAKLPEERYATITEFAGSFRNTIKKHEGEATSFFTVDLSAPTAQWRYQALVAPNELTSEHTIRLEMTLRESGVNLWQGHSHVAGTLGWKEALRQAVKDSACVVVPLTENALYSDWVDLVLGYARHFEKPVYGFQLTWEVQNRGLFTAIVDSRENDSDALAKLLKMIKYHDT